MKHFGRIASFVMIPLHLYHCWLQLRCFGWTCKRCFQDGMDNRYHTFPDFHSLFFSNCFWVFITAWNPIRWCSNSSPCSATTKFLVLMDFVDQSQCLNAQETTTPTNIVINRTLYKRMRMRSWTSQKQNIQNKHLYNTINTHNFIKHNSTP